MNKLTLIEDNLTESEVAALKYLSTVDNAALSTIGFAIRDRVTQHGQRKASPAPQGVALFASRFVRRLTKRGFVTHCVRGHKITPAGRNYLKGLEA